ncbi:MAG: ABC transporter permease subunit [Clostridiales bacterium]|nr:ABC transporter permease subunit [Clostridiales bacterium]
MRKRISDILYTVAGAALIVAVWFICAAVSGDDLLFPTPADTVHALKACLKAGWFWRAFLKSGLRALVAFAVSLAEAGLCAFLGKTFRPVQKILAPIVGTVRSVPTMSVILILIILLGGEYTPVVVAGLVVFPVLYSGLWAAMATIPRELDETALLYAPSKPYRFFKVTLPLLMPSFSLTVAGALGLTLKLTVAAEVLAQTRQSIGLLMQQSQISFDTGRLMALTIAVIVASLLMEGLVWLVRRIFKWDQSV